MRPSVIQQALAIIDQHRAHEAEKARRSKGRQLMRAMVKGDHNKIAKLLTVDDDAALDRAAENGVPLAAGRVIERNRRLGKITDTSPEATRERHHKLVDALCSGGRCSVSRAYKLAGYGKHRPSLNALLELPGIRARLQWHIDNGHSLPPKYVQRILAVLEEYDLGLR